MIDFFLLRITCENSDIQYFYPKGYISIFIVKKVNRTKIKVIIPGLITLARTRQTLFYVGLVQQPKEGS